MSLDCRQCHRSWIRHPQLFFDTPTSPSTAPLAKLIRRPCAGASSNSRSGTSSTRLYASEQFYDDFEDFGELGGEGSVGGSNTNKSNNGNTSNDGKNDMGLRGDRSSSSSSSMAGRDDIPTSAQTPTTNNDVDDLGADDDAVMKELRKRMNDLSKMRVGEVGDNVDVDNDDDDEEEEEEDDDEYDEEEEEEEYDDADSGSALPDLEGSTISSIDDLIGFAQAKARLKKSNLSGGSSSSSGDSNAKSTIGGTWEDENWARPIPINSNDEDEEIDFDNILEGGIILIANPAKFCSDLVSSTDDDEYGDGGGSENERKKRNSFLGGLFDDPFPSSLSSSRSSSSSSSKKGESISPALLAKFGITLPPSPDLGPDRRADLLPVVLLIDRDPISGCRAVLMNRRTGNLMGDLPSTLFESTTQQQQQQQATGGGGGDADDDSGDEGGGGYYPSTPHPLSAFMIQPLWWAGSSPGGTIDNSNRGGGGGGGGINAIRMVHACPYVNGSVPLAKSDGLYWGGNPVQAQEAMRDSRLEKPLSGFDFKFFIQTTRWLPSQVSNMSSASVHFIESDIRITLSHWCLSFPYYYSAGARNQRRSVVSSHCIQRGIIPFARSIGCKTSQAAMD